MSVDLKIEWKDKRGSIKLNRYNADIERRLQKGLSKFGALMVRQLRLGLKGSNPTTFFYKSPHAELRSRTGALRRSINMQLSPLTVKIGPGPTTNIYANANEYGATIPVTEKMRRFLHSQGIHLRASTDEIVIPARPWFWPTVDKTKDDGVNLIRAELNKPLG